MSEKCPSHDELSGYLLGTLAEPRAREIAGHVCRCSACESTIASLDGRTETLSPQSNTSEASDNMDTESAKAAIAVGKTIRDYKLILKLGEGGMGTVYKAVHTKLDKKVAFKVLPADRLQNKNAVDRFEREMRAVGKLDHPNIVRATDAGEYQGLHYLVMELVEGVDLNMELRRHGPLPISEACEYIRQAALGLQCAHENGLVHRDIKPSNLMLVKDSSSAATDHDDVTVKILDMGLALLDDMREIEGKEVTQTGSIVGTIKYMAPEQCSDSHAVDIRADIYGAGAMLYKLLTGATPFEGEKYDSPIKHLMALANEEPTLITEERPEVPTQLAKVIHRMLAKSPDARYATPIEVADALRQFVPHRKARIPDRPTASSLSLPVTRQETAVPPPSPPPPPVKAPPKATASPAPQAQTPVPREAPPLQPKTVPARPKSKLPPRPGGAPSQTAQERPATDQTHAAATDAGDLFTGITIAAEESATTRLTEKKKTKKPDHSKWPRILAALTIVVIIGLGVALALVLTRDDDPKLAGDSGTGTTVPEDGQPTSADSEGTNPSADKTGDGESQQPDKDSSPPADSPQPAVEPNPAADEDKQPEPEPVPPDAAAPLHAPPPIGEKADLLSIVDPQQDFKIGEWQRTDDGLVSPEMRFARLQVPIELPPEYDLNLKLQYDSAVEGEPTLVLGVGSSGNQFLIVLDGQGGRSGLDQLNGQRYYSNSNPSSRAVQALRARDANTISCRVRSSGVAVLCNGMQVFKWQGDFQQLNVPDTGWKIPNHAALMIGTSNVCRISDIELINGGIEEPLANLHLAHREFNAGPVEQGAPIPTVAAQKAKRTELRKRLQAEFDAAQTKLQRQALAQSLRDRGIAGKDSAERYLFLQLASEAAEPIGDVDLMLAVADDLASHFAIDEFDEKVKVFESIAKNPDLADEAARRALPLIESAIERDQFDKADRLVAFVRKIGRDNKQADLIQAAADQDQQIDSLREAESEVRASLAAAEDPSNADANLAAGKFYCFAKADWDRGLVCLTRGSDPTLKSLAEEDLAFPVLAEQQAALADAWWDLAQQKRDFERKHAQLRAHHWYELAVSGLGDPKAEVAKQRIAQVRQDYPRDVRRVVDYGNVQLYATLYGHKSVVYAVAFSPDSRLLASASDDGLVKVWDVSTGRERFSLKGHRDGVTSVAFSWDGKILASVGKDRALIFWDPRSGKMMKRFDDWNPANRIEFAPNSYLMSAVLADNQAILWSPITQREVARLQGQCIATFAPHGRRIATASGNQLKVYRNTGEEQFTLSGHGRAVLAADYSPDGRIVASAADDNIVHLWNAETGESVLRVGVEAFRFHEFAFTPDGKAFSTCDGNRIKFWRTSDGSAVSSIDVGFEPKHRLSTDGLFLAAACSNNLVRLYAFAPVGNLNRKLGYKLGHHPADAIRIRDHWYKLVPGKDQDWDTEAQARCAQLGGYLACIESKDEAIALARLAEGRRVLIGGIRNPAGLWSWINGSSTQIRYWAKGQPDLPPEEDAFLCIHPDGQWDDVVRGGDGTEGFICEWDF